MLLFFLYFGYGTDRITSGLNANEENIMATLSACQAILLASFAAILSAYRSEIVDKTDSTSSSAGFRNQYGNIVGTNAVLANEYPYAPPSFM